MERSDNFGNLGKADSSRRDGVRVVGLGRKTPSPRLSNSMTVRRQRGHRLLAGPLHLEDRVVPASFTAVINPATNPSGAVAELVGIFNQANADAGTSETINLFAGGKYEFNDPVNFNDGGTALPVLIESNSTYLYSAAYVPKTFTINGLGATFDRPPGAPACAVCRETCAADRSWSS